MNEQTKPLTAQEFKTLAEVIVHDTNAKLVVVQDAMKALDLKYNALACETIRARIAQFAASPITDVEIEERQIVGDIGQSLRNSHAIALAVINTDDPIFASDRYEELNRQHCLLLEQERAIRYITTDGFSVDGLRQIDQLDSDEVARYLKHKERMRLKGKTPSKKLEQRTPEELAQLIATARRIMST